MTRMHFLFVTAIAASCCLLHTPAAAAEGFDGTYTASYEGSFKGTAANLKGTQVWSFDRKTENRACTIALKR
jgi:hypothetical protein